MGTTEVTRAHIASLIKMAKADNVLTQNEEVFVKSVAIRAGVSSDEFNDIVANLDSIEVKAPSSQEEKVRQFFTFLVMMTLDLNVQDEEAEMCNHLGQLLGLDKGQVATAIEVTKDSIGEQITPAQISAILG